MNRKIGSDIWYEWSSYNGKKPYEDEMLGILCGLQETNTTEGSMFQTSRIFVYRRLLALWGQLVAHDRKLFIDDIKLVSSESGKRIYFFVHNRAIEHIYSKAEGFETAKKRFWSWIRGLWGACGFLYIPKAGYYLMLRLPENGHEEIKDILQSAALNFSSRVKSHCTEIILRDRQQITDFLGWMGLVGTILALEDKSIMREAQSNQNRIVNCDLANIGKTVRTASKQLQIIELLEKNNLYETLPQQLKEVIIARKENPEATLSEIGKNLLCPISKSTVEYRWNKIYSIASQTTEGRG